MAKSVHSDVLDAALNIIKNNAIQQVPCSAQPTTFYEAVDPLAWAATTAYGLGAAARPTVRNGFVYEATVAGTSAATEPTWPTTAGQTVADGTVTWTARASKGLASVTMVSGDFTLAAGSTSGRKVTVAAKTAVAVHTSGTANHNALVDTANKRLLLVTTTAATALAGGGTVDIGTWSDEIADPA